MKINEPIQESQFVNQIVTEVNNANITGGNKTKL